MGIKVLFFTFYICKRAKNRMSELAGKVVGVDFSLLLNRLIFGSADLQRIYHLQPEVDVSEVIFLFLDNCVKIFKESNVEPVFVLDGDLGVIRCLRKRLIFFFLLKLRRR